jgi:hypothetical protein
MMLCSLRFVFGEELLLLACNMCSFFLFLSSRFSKRAGLGEIIIRGLSLFFFFFNVSRELEFAFNYGNGNYLIN